MNFKTVMDILVILWVSWQIVIYNKKALLYFREAYSPVSVLGSILGYIGWHVITIILVFFYSWG